MKSRLCVLLLMVSLMSAITVQAQDAGATPEPGSRADNECYAGGTMAGKCDNGFHNDGSTTPAEVEWAWRCGWYMARFNDGRIPRAEVPADCGILLPAITIASGVADCIVTFGGSATECISGNILSQDTGSNGSFEDRWYIISDATAGDGGNCPAGSTYAIDVSSYQASQPDFYAFVLSHGFKGTDDFCHIT